MRRFIVLFVLCVLLPISIPAGVASCTPPSASSVVSTLPPLGACLIQAAGGDFVDALTDPATLIPAVISQCLQYGAATATSIVSYLDSWFASSPSVDAGTGGAISPAALVRARQMKVHAAALAYQGIVIVFPDSGVQ
jgi:hypothetical protein